MVKLITVNFFADTYPRDMVRLMSEVQQTTTPIADAINAATVAELRAAMAAERISQRDIAAQVGMSHITVNRYLNGHRDVPLVLLFAVAEASGVPANVLVERIGRRLAS